MTPPNNTRSMDDGDNGHHQVDEEQLIARALFMIDTLLHVGFDPLINPLDMLVCGLMTPMCLRALGMTDAEITTEQDRLTLIAGLANIGPLRDLMLQRRALMSDVPEAGAKS